MPMGIYKRTKEHNNKIAEANRGRKASEETKKKISEALGGRKLSKIHRKNISKGNKGRIVSKATRDKISKSNTDNPLCKRFGKDNHFFGKKHTNKSLKKMSESSKGQIAWNKGLTKEIDDRVKQYSKKNKGQKRPKISGKNHPHYGKSPSQKTLIKMSATRQGIDLKDWEKFVSLEPYDQNFDRRFKKFIRERDSNTCLVCNIHREKLKIALDIHHIDYNKLNTTKENCVSLCRNCHAKTNFNRKYWTKFFQDLLKEKYGYKD